MKALLDVLLDALPDVENRLVCLKWRERCSKASTATAGDVDELLFAAVDLIERLEEIVDTLDPSLDRVKALIDGLLHGELDVENRLVCLKLSDPCSGSSALVVGDADQFLPPP